MKALRAGLAVMMATLGGSAAVAVASGDDPSAAAIPMPGAEACAGVAATPDASAAAAVMNLVNVLRERAGRVHLARSGALAAYAQRRSLEMASAGLLQHDLTDGRFPFAPRDRGAGETLAMGLSPQDTVTRWLNSPMHRRTMLAPRFRVAGVGVARMCTGALVVTQDLLTD
jgi:uncharacterized protein YkwD